MHHANKKRTPPLKDMQANEINISGDPVFVAFGGIIQNEIYTINSE
jgi:hypothetical protein